MIFLFLLLWVVSSFKVAVITDLHYDQYYLPNTPNNCVLANYGIGCCRNTSIPLEPYQKAEIYGEYLCDSPYHLINKTFFNIQELNPEIILWLGDNNNHGDFRQSLSDNIKITGFITQKLTDNFKKIYPSLGNHDTFPVDQISPSYFQLFQGLNSLWCPLINQSECHSLVKGGYYSIIIRPNTRLISLNTVFYSPNNLLVKEDQDPSEQISWLLITLNLSRKNKESVWIIGHIQPEYMKPKYGKTISNIIKEYSDIIQYTFWGHTHDDHFTVYNNVVEYTIPSIVPMNTNPSFRIFDISQTQEFGQNEIVNYYQYNLNDLSKDKFDLYYDAKSSYGLKDLSFQSWFDMAQRLLKNDTLAQLYHQHFNSGYETNHCDEICVRNYYCKIMYMDKISRDLCVI